MEMIKCKICKKEMTELTKKNEWAKDSMYHIECAMQEIDKARKENKQHQVSKELRKYEYK